MRENPLTKLQALGQSIWLDYTRRDLIATGELPRLIEDDGLSGMTSNPSIFEKAIAHGDYYDEEIRDMLSTGGVPFPFTKLSARKTFEARPTPSVLFLTKRTGPMVM